MDENNVNDTVNLNELEQTEDKTDPAAAPENSADGNGTSGNNNKKTIMIAVIAVAAVAVIIAAVFIIRGIRSGSKPEESSDNTADIINDLTNSDGSLLSDEEIRSRLAEENDPELMSVIAEATTKFAAETGTGSANQIVANTTKAQTPAATTAKSGAAETTKAGSAPTTAAGGNQGSAATTAANGGNQNTQPAATTAAATEPSGGNTADPAQADAALTQIKAFYDRKCYLEGKMFENGQGSPMSIAFDGDDYEVYTSLDGVEISIMKKGDKFYMKRPAAKQYVELSESLLKTVGLSIDDINVDFGAKDFNSLTAQSVFDVTVNGQPGVCYQYKTSDGYSEFYAVNGQLKEIDIKDNNLITKTQLQIDVFSTSIPSDQLNVNGYEPAKSIFSMLADMM